VKTGHHKDDEDVGEKETRNGDQEIREKCGAAIIEPAPENGRTNPDWEGEGPGQDRAHDEEGKAVEESFPDLFKDRLIVLPGNGFAREEVTVKVEVLDMKRLVQMKFLPKPLHNFRSELGIQGINLAGLARSDVNDQKRYNRDKEERDDLLYNIATYE